MKANIIKIELLVVDFHDRTQGEIKAIFETFAGDRYDFIGDVKKIESKETEWHDDHPLNMSDDENQKCYEKLFPSECDKCICSFCDQPAY